MGADLTGVVAVRYEFREARASLECQRKRASSAVWLPVLLQSIQASDHLIERCIDTL
jgi:hypothetical protein